MVEDNRRGTGKSTQSWATDGDESIDIAELDETIRNFSQDLLQMAASKNNFDRFKIVSGQLTSRISFCLSSSIESTIAQSQNYSLNSFSPRFARLYPPSSRKELKSSSKSIKSLGRCLRTTETFTNIPSSSN